MTVSYLMAGVDRKNPCAIHSNYQYVLSVPGLSKTQHQLQAMNSTLEHIRDIFRLFGNITLRRMFSGHGIFYDGVMIGLYYDGALYLKADYINVKDFTRMDLEQFTYMRQGNSVGLSYYRAPDSVLEEPDEAAKWGRRSYEAAVRNASKKHITRKL